MLRLRTVLCITVLGLAFTFAACAPKEEPAEEPMAEEPMAEEPMAAEPVTATATLQGLEGTDVSGTVTLTESDGGVTVSAHVSGVAPAGLHGFHIHETGDCSAPDFTSAGGHFNPTGAPHGGPNDAEHHAGDLGNIEVGEDGHGMLELTSNMITLSPGPSSVVGKAMILHAGEDDLVSQPTGDAGGRLACGVIELAGDDMGGEMGSGMDEGMEEGQAEPEPVS